MQTPPIFDRAALRAAAHSLSRSIHSYSLPPLLIHITHGLLRPAPSLLVVYPILIFYIPASACQCQLPAPCAGPLSSPGMAPILTLGQPSSDARRWPVSAEVRYERSQRAWSSRERMGSTCSFFSSRAATCPPVFQPVRIFVALFFIPPAAPRKFARIDDGAL